MSRTTQALEHEVAAILDLRSGPQGPRILHAIDAHFDRIMHLIAPRIRHFTRVYGLVDMTEDARQASAIGVHRAICEYDPARALFTTFVNWQLRCELQALRHRVRLDSRDSAKRVGARTISLDAMIGEGEDGPGFEIEDESASARVEAETSARLAHRTLDDMLDDYDAMMRERADRDQARATVRSRETMPGTLHPDELDALERDLAMERAIVARYVFADSDKSRFDPDHPLDREKQRQISRRVLRNIRARLDSVAP